jgi:ABC-type sugar transport system substrate-binding protein
MRRVFLLSLFGAACSGNGKQSSPIPGDRAPAIIVEVLNASGVAGEARVATRALREAGIDVVYFGNALTASSSLDSTRIVVRRGTRQAAERVRAALGGGQILVELDSAKLLDVSVLLGVDFASTARTRGLGFHP